MRAAAYVRVSTVEQAEGLSLDGQVAKITAEIERRAWRLCETVTDSASGKNLQRPGLARLLEKMEDGIYEVLVVSRLDRLSRSASDFFLLLDRAKKQGWSILCLDPAVDMTDPFGEAMAGMAAIFAQLERRLISQRQIESVAARKAAGTHRLSPACISPVQPETLAVIERLMAHGLGKVRIARELDMKGIASPNGGPWAPSTVGKHIAQIRGRA